MTKEEIIATAIREAFRCGREAVESNQRMFDAMQNKIAELKEENGKLGKVLEEKDATITELRQELRRLLTTVPVASPADSIPSPCINFSEGDQVLVSGNFFEDTTSRHGVILSETDESSVVMITEEGDDYEDVEFVISNEYLKEI